MMTNQTQEIAAVSNSYEDDYSFFSPPDEYIEGHFNYESNSKNDENDLDQTVEICIPDFLRG